VSVRITVVPIIKLYTWGDREGYEAHGWRIHCDVEVTEWSTNKQHTLSSGGHASVLRETTTKAWPGWTSLPITIKCLFSRCVKKSVL
jgi:hypothetical protein